MNTIHLLSGSSSQKFVRCGSAILYPCCLKVAINMDNIFVRCVGDYTARQSRMLKKFMTGSSRQRKKWFNADQPVSKSLGEFSFIHSPKGMYKKDKSYPVKPIRRVEVLNTVFMEYITGMMATGDVAEQLVGLGIEVTRVQISPDFSCVNVYWAAKGTESDVAIEEILTKAAGRLRHECSKLRVIGVVPPIRFVKDKTFSKVMEVETLLAKCDFGEDFVPTASASLFHTSQPPSPQNGLNSELTLKINKIAKDYQECQATTLGEYVDSSIENVEINFSVDSNMRQNILGLDHDRIMETINKGIKRKNEMLLAKQRHSGQPQLAREEDGHSMEHFTPEDLSKQINDDKQRSKNFETYLKQRKVLKARELKALTALAKEKEFYESEKESRWEETQKYEEEYDDRDDKDFEQELQQTLEEYKCNESLWQHK